IAHVGHFEQSGARDALRDGEAVAIRIGALVVFTIDSADGERGGGEVQCVEFAGEQRGITAGALVVTQGDGLHAGRYVEARRELAGVVVIASPAAAQYGGIAQCIRDAEARLVIRALGRESAHGNRRVALVPKEATILGGRTTGVVFGIVEDGEAEAETVRPG